MNTSGGGTTDFRQLRQNEKSKAASWLPVVLAIAVIAVIVAVLAPKDGDGGSSAKKPDGGNDAPAAAAAVTPEPVPTPEPTSQPTPEPTPPPAPVFYWATASSTRGTDSQGGQYSVDSVLSQDNMTKWVPEKRAGSGIGEWVQVYADSPQHVSGIVILNGYHKDPATWIKNNRVQACTITFSTGEQRSFVLDDTMEFINLDLGGAVDTSFIRLTINSVYKGTSWDDTAITYLGAY